MADGGSGVKESSMQQQQKQQGPSAAVSGGSGKGVGMTEHQVAKLMEEDMGSAMQYLQGKGLCLMPISLASAISTVTGGSHSKPPPPTARYNHQLQGDGSSAAFAPGGQQSRPTITNAGGAGGGPSKSIATNGTSPVAMDASSTSKSDA